MKSFQIVEKDGKLEAEDIMIKEIGEVYVPNFLDRSILAKLDKQPKGDKMDLTVYCGVDKKCLYMWILRESGIGEKYTPAILKEILDLLL